MANVLFKRALSAAVLIPTVVWVVAGASPWVFGGVAVALSAAAAWSSAGCSSERGASGPD